MSELQQVKTLIGITGNTEDSLLELLLVRAGRIINNLSRTPNDYDYLKVDAVVYAYNQRGAEGNKMVSTGGFAQTWYHDSMVSFIKANLPAQYVIQ